MILPLLSVNSFFREWSHWLPMSILAVMIAIIIHSALIMFAKGFNIPELEKYAQSEILQAAATAMMAIFLVGMVTGISDFSVSLLGQESTVLCKGKAEQILKTGENETMVFKNTLDIVRCRVQEKAIAIAEVQDRLTTGADVWGKFTALNLGLSLFGVTFFKGDWVGSLYQETEIIRITNNLATVLLVGMNAVSFLALYIKNTMLSLFIPVGILLRSFHFTRGAGALFIAIGIGLYFIFPILYILLDPGFVKVDTPPAVGGGIELLQKTVCFPTMSAAITIVNTNAQSASGSSLAAGRLRDNLALAYVALILHPMVAFFLTLAFVRYLMVVLGGDTYALMRMVAKVI
jgi:hypothetical protein